MLTPDTRLVFVPLIGSSTVSDWTTVSHRRAWGLLEDDLLDVLLCLRVDGSISTGHNTVGEIRLFDAELAHIKPITENDPGVPDEVYIELAKRALVREAN